MSAESTVVRARWHCGMYVGPAQWRESTYDWEYEPAECDTDWEDDHDAEEWAEKNCSSYCPSCGALVWQSDDHANLIPSQ